MDAPEQPPELAAAGDDGEPPSPPQVRTGLWRRLLPWGSLVVGVVGAGIMDRGPARAPIVAGAALLLWGTLLLRLRLGGPEAEDRGRVRSAVVKVAHTSSLVATQSMIQLTLFFALPFYVRAMALDAGHVAFVAVLTVMAGVSLWDPWSERLLARPGPALLFPVLAGFSALNAVLPGFGVANRWALWLAAGLSTAGVPLVVLGSRRDKPGARVMLAALVATLALPALLLSGGARIIPAAPLKLVKAQFGTNVENHWVVNPIETLHGAPPQLICATAIYAPLGIHEQLVHVWRKDGEERARVELKIRGGRTGGYRTRSRIRHFGKDPEGSWECRVETAAGQLLGKQRVRIEPLRQGNVRSLHTLWSGA